jgi:hypothetical protein
MVAATALIIGGGTLSPRRSHCFGEGAGQLVVVGEAADPLDLGDGELASDAGLGGLDLAAGAGAAGHDGRGGLVEGAEDGLEGFVADDLLVVLDPDPLV